MTGMKIMGELAKATSSRGLCLMLHSPITDGGKALAKKLHAVDVDQSGKHMLCRLWLQKNILVFFFFAHITTDPNYQYYYRQDER
jgi:hypothetical protein